MSLVGAETKSFVFGFAKGDPASLTDPERYFTIPEATFSAYFTIAPVSDPCTIMSYELVFAKPPPIYLNGIQIQVPETPET